MRATAVSALGTRGRLLGLVRSVVVRWGRRRGCLQGRRLLAAGWPPLFGLVLGILRLLRLRLRLLLLLLLRGLLLRRWRGRLVLLGRNLGTGYIERSRSTSRPGRWKLLGWGEEGGYCGVSINIYISHVQLPA